jgi:hypothetical protein
MRPIYPDEIADIEEERLDGRWREQLNPERETTSKAVSKT